MTTPSSGAEWVPDVCTLPTMERPLRRAEFDTLFATATRAAQRVGPTHLRLSLAGGTDLESTVRDLAARESECCSFFAFTVTSTGAGLVSLDIEVPHAYVDILDALGNRADHARTRE